MEQADRLARCLVVVTVLDIARRVEPNVAAKSAPCGAYILRNRSLAE